MKTPGLIGVHDERAVVAQQSVIQVDDAADETRGEGPDAAIIQQIDARRPAIGLEHAVIAQMRVAVDHPVMAEGRPPGPEQRPRDLIAVLQGALLVFEHLAAFEPGHGQQPLGGQLRRDFGHADLRLRHAEWRRYSRM